MKLRHFLETLVDIESKHGGDLEVTMADDIPVVNPILFSENSRRKQVIITDELPDEFPLCRFDK